MRFALLVPLCASMLLGGCVVFERPPVSKLECDPALAGRWLPLTDEKDGTTPQPIPGAAAVIDADCDVTLYDNATAMPPFRAHGFTHSGMRYMVMRPTDMERLFGSLDKFTEPGEGNPAHPPGDLLPPKAVFLLQYRIDADTMSISGLSPEKIGALLKSGKIRGRAIPHYLPVVEGNARQLRRLLARQGDWRASDNGVPLWQFRRAATVNEPATDAEPLP